MRSVAQKYLNFSLSLSLQLARRTNTRFSFRIKFYCSLHEYARLLYSQNASLSCTCEAARLNKDANLNLSSRKSICARIVQSVYCVLILCTYMRDTMLGQRDRWRFSERRDASAQSGLHPGLRTLCVRCTRRMLLPQLCGPVSAIVVYIPGKSHAFLLSLSLISSLSLRCVLPPPSAHPPSLPRPSVLYFRLRHFLARRHRINDLHNRCTCELR